MQRVDRYDLVAIGFRRSGEGAVGSFEFMDAPEGATWWWENMETDEGRKRLEQMRDQYDNDTHIEGDYGCITVRPIDGMHMVRITVDSVFTGNDCDQLSDFIKTVALKMKLKIQCA